jgi:hypothetical protein
VRHWDLHAVSFAAIVAASFSVGVAQGTRVGETIAVAIGGTSIYSGCHWFRSFITRCSRARGGVGRPQ